MMRRGRGLIVALLILSLPIFLGSYAMMIGDVVKGWGWWALPVVFAHITGWIGIASLFDRQQGR